MRTCTLPPEQPEHVLRSLAAFDRWYREAHVNDRCSYFVGEWLPEGDAVGCRVRELQQEGWLLTFTKRHKKLVSPKRLRENPSFEFVAIKSNPHFTRAIRIRGPVEP